MIGPKQVTGVDVPDLPGNLLDPDGLPDQSQEASSEIGNVSMDIW